MKQLNCPANGLRPISEFVCWGERRAMPDPAATSDADWADYVFNRDGAPGVKIEWWCHTPSTTWFLVERDTGLDYVLRTWLPGDEP
ncbi:MAG: sarcosine oxidase subunit delta [Burkholderiales bacterium]|nr:sarcosine oxidase subunit delta [Burkholderiales bacterium]MDE1925859.1 sarcosine oxidase subunit delta [Burkholderiales bacterium]MDE2157406.1 sarcosine oxidase subunit delta [Burkholderiales bacterium]MDE2503070.1 sarcosine oxidase subunit delta [Burkholderiales bacterium]